ncbi:hypothetical protein ACFPRL_28325 [Pseudoclavibacter helvolus]
MGVSFDRARGNRARPFAAECRSAERSARRLDRGSSWAARTTRRAQPQLRPRRCPLDGGRCCGR